MCDALRYAARPGTHRLPTLTLSNLVNDGWADVSAQNVKSAMIRQAAPLFSQMAAHFCTAPTIEHTKIKQATHKLDEFYTILSACGFAIPEAELKQLRSTVQVLATSLQHLRVIAEAEGVYRWPIRPKMHKMCHLPFHAGCINPMRVSCYADESHIGTLTKTWAKSMSGRYKDQAQVNVLSKRWVAVLLRLELGME